MNAKRSAPVTAVAVELDPVVILRSKEPLLADRAVTSLKALARKRDANVEISELSAVGYQKGTLIDLTSPSLFGEERLVIVPDFENAGTDLIEETLAYIPQAGSDVTLVIRINNLQKGKKLCDTAREYKFQVIDIPEVKYPSDKIKLITNDVRIAGRSITKEAAQALVDALGSDLRELCAAVQQLLADTEGTISPEMVNRYWGGKIEATGFSVADAVATGQTANAVSLLRHARSTGVPPNVVVFALASKFRGLAKVHSGKNASQLGMPGWLIDRAKRELHGWREDTLAAAIEAIAQADAGTKGGEKDPDYAVEKAVLTICQLHMRNNPNL